jgi:RNA polymerase sigma factor (sigma-70 family)
MITATAAGSRNEVTAESAMGQKARPYAAWAGWGRWAESPCHHDRPKRRVAIPPISRFALYYRPREVPLPPFEQVIESHGPALLRFCVGRVGPSRGEDVFQEAMIAALRAYPGLRDPDAVRPWLYAIASRKAIDSQRTEARAPIAVGDSVLLADGAADPPAFDTEIWTLVRKLPDKQRQAVGLRFLADLAHAEIADAMGTSEEASRRNVHEGLSRLRRELGGDLTFPGSRTS